MKILQFILKCFFPITCIYCNRADFLTEKIGLCKKCYTKQKKFDYEPYKLCEICNNRIVQKTCDFCESRNVFFDKLFFIREKDDFVRDILNKIKFENKVILSNLFLLGLSKILKSLKKEQIELIAIVPSHKKTIRKRPHYPTKPVSAKLHRKLKIFSSSQLFSKKSSELQSGKTFTNRFLHARNSFQIHENLTNKLSGNAILLDDIFTTGATINECAKILKENGVEKVFVVVLTKKTIEEIPLDFNEPPEHKDIKR